MAMPALKKPHVVMVPFPAMGHSIPSLELAKLLASRSISVTFITTPPNVRRLENMMEKAPCLDVRVIGLSAPHAIEGLPEGRESMDLVTKSSLLPMLNFVENMGQSFESWVESQDRHNKPVCIVSDMFIDWTVHAAKRFRVPRVVFATCGAFGTSVLHAVCASISQNKLQRDCAGNVTVENGLPFCMKFHRNQMPERYYDPDPADPWLQFSIEKMESLTNCWGIMVNTFDGLEDQYLQHLKIISWAPVWSVGPLLPSLRDTNGNKNRGKTADISEEAVRFWLDTQLPRSVVFVSFGSQAFLSEKQTKALAKGLEASQQAFIWSIKVDPEAVSANPKDLHSAYLPQGFLQRMMNKGLVIWGWVPQLVILSHPSVGMFLTHCGWNSTLESIMLAGVPLVTWPMFADQHFNSKLVTEELGIGVQFCQHKDEIPAPHDVEKALRLVMTSEDGKEMRNRAEKLKEIAGKSVGNGGSSRLNFVAFADEIHRLTKNPISNS